MALAAPAAAPPPAVPLGDTYDHHGFLVKPEFSGLYNRFAPIYAAEERERSQKWAELMVELAALVSSQPEEGDASLLQRALAHLTDTTASGAPPPQAAALLQRLASLVQAGLPMRSRGDFWRLFLNADAKRRGKEAEYTRLCAEVEQLEALAAANAAVPAVPPLPGAAKVAAAAAINVGPYPLVADCTAAAAARLHRIDVFQITALDESPEVTPAKRPSRSEGGEGTRSEAGALGTAAAVQPAVTPASTLLTAQAYSTSSSSSCPGGSGGSLTAGTPLTNGSVAGTAGDGECATSGSMKNGGVAGVSGSSSSSIARTAERWRQGEILSQIDKDLHRTFPGHPALDQGGRAMLRRILGAYARRNPVVGYCQGLNFLAATLMLWMPEEDAFWCLCAVIEDILGCSYFDERMVLPQVDVLVFGHLLQGRFPTLWRHLQALEVDAGSVTMHWFLCCFLNSLPLDSALRVWDLLFFEGSAVVLFRVALALIEIYDQALMCCRESSDGYMLLQSCAQMTYDSSRLVDTACIGYSHLQPAGLSVLRQRYRPSILENLRGAFAADDEYEEYVRSQQSSPDSAGAAAPPTFADAFQRVSSAVLEAEEAAARAAQYAAADGGHVSLRGRGYSQRSGLGSSSASSGSQPASPLARVRQAVSGLTSRLVPSALPQLLPAGAVDATGQELSPMSSGSSMGPSPLRARHARRSLADAAPAGVQQGALHLRRISVGERSEGATDSPGSSGSAGTGAALRRQQPGLTPFGSTVVLLVGSGAEGGGSQQQGALPAAVTAAQQQQQRQQPGERIAAPLSWTPPRPGLARGGMPRGLGPAAVAQSQPATPSALLVPPQPPGSHRRAMTFGATGSGHTRRRRRLTIDLLSLANLRPNLHQPGVAAALAIAANPSPHAARAAGRGRPAGSMAGSLQPSPLAVPRDAAEVDSAGSGNDGAEQLLLPIRTLRFDDDDSIAAGDADGVESPSGVSILPGRVRRAVTAPVRQPAPLAGPAAVLQPSIHEELPVSSSAQRVSSSGDSLSSGEEAGIGVTTGAAVQPQQGAMTAAAPAAAASSAQDCQDSSSGATSSSFTCADSSSPSSGSVIPAAWSPEGGGGDGDALQQPRPSSRSTGGCVVRGSTQSRLALLDVVAQLQAEVAVAESRRHEAEQAAEEAQQTAQDLRRQVDKVEALAASKEAMIAELTSKLAVSSAASAELDGELAAARMALEGEEAALEQMRRQLGAADALVQRLMAAVAERGRTSPNKRPGGASCVAVAAAAEPAHSSATSSSCGSPQSSIGSVAPRSN